MTGATWGEVKEGLNLSDSKAKPGRAWVAEKEPGPFLLHCFVPCPSATSKLQLDLMHQPRTHVCDSFINIYSSLNQQMVASIADSGCSQSTSPLGTGRLSAVPCLGIANVGSMSHTFMLSWMLGSGAQLQPALKTASFPGGLLGPLEWMKVMTRTMTMQ